MFVTMSYFSGERGFHPLRLAVKITGPMPYKQYRGYRTSIGQDRCVYKILQLEAQMQRGIADMNTVLEMRRQNSNL